MRCLYPTRFPNSGDMLVRCGQCMPCRITRRKELVTKMRLEGFYSPNTTYFVTLTYSPEHLPDSDKYPAGNLSKDDYQKFLKRLRKNAKHHYGITGIRYFGVGEYGDKSQRAHYHFILYNLSSNPYVSEELVKSAWKLGFVQIRPWSPSDDGAMDYTAGYVLKKMTTEKDFSDGRHPEFSTWSRKPALGSPAISAFARRLFKNNLMPSAFSASEMVLLKRVYGISLPKFWHGNYYSGTKMYQLDKKMLEYVLEEMYPGMKARLKRDLDNMDFVEYKYFSARRDAYLSRSAHDQLLRDFEIVDDEKTKETVEKLRSKHLSEKIARKRSQGQKL